MVHFPVPGAPVADPGLFRAAEGLLLALGSAAPLLELQSRQTEILERMLAHAERPPPAPDSHERIAVNRARAYLCDHWREPVTLGEVAAVAGLGPFVLVHQFTGQERMPPHAFLVHLRIERARHLLEAGHPATLVAAEAGFSDQSHFTRHFKRIMGVTPGEYAGLHAPARVFPGGGA
jgi:AraC-like DNA-binding protein